MPRNTEYQELGEIGSAGGVNVGSTTPQQQTSTPGAAQTQNSAIRAENIDKKQECNLTGGFYNRGNCYKGEDALDVIEGIGENSPAYERAQEWLAEYNAEPGLDEDTTDEGDPFGAYVIDTDGDGFVDTVQGTNPYGETVLVQGNDGLNDEIQAAQDLKDSIYNQEGWDDLEDWEQDQQLINAGGTAINGTDGTEPEEERGYFIITIKAKEAVDQR